MTPDLINGLFEGAGAVFMLVNIWRCAKDKHVKGVHWSATGFFTVWGLWNLYFYPALHLWYSLAGGVLLVGLQLVWLSQMFYYTRFPGGAQGSTYRG